MAITYGYFNSVNGDRKYNAETMSEYFDGIVSDGVYETVGDKLQVVASGTDMSISIKTGRALIDCHWLKNDSVHNITLSAADVQLSRYDSIGIKLDYNERTMSFVVNEGTLANTPSILRPKNTETVKYLWLADVKINAGVSVVRQGNVINRRGYSYCPWVTGVVKQVDTSQLFAQWQDACESYYNSMTAEINAYFDNRKAEFESWFDTLTSTLTVDTYIQKYQRSYEVTEEVMELEIGIPDYDSTKDVLFANINGVEFIESVDYQISGDKIVLFNSIKGTNQITFIVLKSKIGGGQGTIIIDSNDYALKDENNSVLLLGG
jgi:hypothetical protein